MFNLVTDMLHAVLTLFLTGDYEGWMRPFLGEEDSALVDTILTSAGK